MAPLASLFILDPPDRLDPPSDTSLALMRESLRRGHTVLCCTLEGLRLKNGRPFAGAFPVDFPQDREMFLAGAAVDLDLSSIDILFMRKDPPVDGTYLDAARILDRLPRHVLQVNAARALLRYSEKLIPSYFERLTPETVVTCSAEALESLLQRWGRIVVKPLNDCSGRGIVAVNREDPSRRSLLAEATQEGKRFVAGQRFLPEIEKGDKRVLLLGGEILGWLRRVPAVGEFRSNINAGGRYVACELTDADRALCARLKPWLVKEGIHLAGVDIVGGLALEVNITSPSCLREINALWETSLEGRILDYMEEHCAP